MMPIGDISLAYLSGKFDAIPQLINDRIATGRPISDVVYEVYREVKSCTKGQEAATFVFSCAFSLKLSNPDLLAIIDRMYRRDDDDSCVELYVHYVKNGGTDASAFHTAIYVMGGRGDRAGVVDAFEKAKALGLERAMQPSLRYNVGQAYYELGQLQAAFELFRDIQREQPDMVRSAKYLRMLANQDGLPEAIAFIQEVGNFPTQPMAHLDELATGPTPWLTSWPESGAQAVVRSVARNGFCVVKQACATPALERLLKRLSASPGLSFPMPLRAMGVEEAEPLFTFDVAALMSEILGKPATVNHEVSCARRVNPEMSDSFTPFHQDMTAFMEFTANIWVPLTPAGGDYPSLELVRKRITEREQVVLSGGEYNLIEIAPSTVEARYPDLLYEVQSTEPGDCVIFLGSTIHRSSNLAKATKTRFNLEIRWS